MKKVRMLYKRLNFNSTAAGRFKMKASLKHSLRIVDEYNFLDKQDGQEWNEHQTNKNLVFINGELKTFAEFSVVERDAFLDSCFSPTQPNNKKVLQKTRSAYGKKLENAIEKETNSIAKEILQLINEVPSSKVIEDHLLHRLHDDEIDMVRKNQRLVMIEKYARAHNSLIDTVNKNSTYIQEGLFKFPKPKDKSINELTNELSSEDYIFHMERFLKKHFPEHEIKAIFCHVDEVKIHSHYFLSGANSKTNELDLHKREIEVVNNYIWEAAVTDNDFENIDIELIPTGKKLSLKERQRFGRYFQRMFFDYTNNNLLNVRGVVAEITAEAERKSKLSKQRNADARLPKSERSHNYAMFVAQEAGQRLESVQAEVAASENELYAKRTEYSFIEKEIENSKLDLNEIATELSTKILRLDAINCKLKEAGEYFSDIKESLYCVISNVINNVYVRTEGLLRGNNAGAEKYAKKILQEYSEITPAYLRDICKSAARARDDVELEERMKLKDKGMDINR